MWKTHKNPNLKEKISQNSKITCKNIKNVEKKKQILYIYIGTTFVTEPGQNRKIAALKPSKCVYLFSW